MDRDYYAARHGAKTEPLDFGSVRDLFLAKFEHFFHKLYFLEATGYECVDRGKIPGTWGDKPESFFFIKLRLRNVWPIPKYIETYDEVKLFSVIEFLYDYVSEPINPYYHSWDNCGWHANSYDKAKGQATYRQDINAILKDYKSGYQLSETGQIVEIPPSGLEEVIAEPEQISTTEPENVDQRVKSAIAKYSRYGATTEDKKDAVRTLADVLEFLKRENVRMPGQDDSDLFRIVNGFDIRHHNREQQGQYDKEVWYKWMFYTFLSSIYAMLKLKAKYGTVG